MRDSITRKNNYKLLSNASQRLELHFRRDRDTIPTTLFSTTLLVRHISGPKALIITLFPFETLLLMISLTVFTHELSFFG